MSAHAKQIGGKHYTRAAIQPYEYAMAHNFNYCQTLALRYITRYRDKDGAKDLQKAIHALQLLLEFEYPTPKARLFQSAASA